MPRPHPSNEGAGGPNNPFIRACAGLTGPPGNGPPAAGTGGSHNNSTANAAQELATARQRLEQQQQVQHQMALQQQHEQFQQQQHAAMQHQMQMQQQMMMLSPGDAAAATAAAVGASMGMTASDFGLGNSNAGMLARSAGGFHNHPAFGAAGIYSHLGSAQAMGLGGAATMHSNQQQSPHLLAPGNAVAGAGDVLTDQQEEELLLNLLIARRNRNLTAMRSGEPFMPTPLTEEYFLARQGGASAAASHTMYGEVAMSEAGSTQHESSLIAQQHQPGCPDGAEGDEIGHSVAQGSRTAMFMSESAPARARQRPFGAETLAAAASIHRGYAGTGLQRPDGFAFNCATNTPLDGRNVERLDRIDRSMAGPGVMSDALMPGGNQDSLFGHANRSSGAHPQEDSPGKTWTNDDDKRNQNMPSKVNAKDTKNPAKRQHKKKPADMPRRPLSAYNLFFSEERERILREIQGAAAAMEEEEGLTSRDDGDKDEHEESATGDGATTSHGDKKPKALLRPLLASQKKRRPHRKTHGKIGFKLLAQKVGARWKALPDDQRKYYQDLALEDMKRQKKAMEEYYQRQAVGTNKTPKEVASVKTFKATVSEKALPESSKDETEVEVEPQRDAIRVER